MTPPERVYVTEMESLQPPTARSRSEMAKISANDRWRHESSGGQCSNHGLTSRKSRLKSNAEGCIYNNRYNPHEYSSTERVSHHSSSTERLPSLQSNLQLLRGAITLCDTCGSDLLSSEISGPRRRCLPNRTKGKETATACGFPPKSSRFHDAVIPQWGSLTFLLLIVYVLTACLPFAHAQKSWRLEPQDTNVIEGASATIFCEINNLQASDVIEWRQYTATDDATLFVDDVKFAGTPDHYSVEANGFGYNLKIDGALKADNTDFKCTVPGWDNRRVHLTVLVEPGSPSIRFNKSENSLAEDDYVTFTCETSGGNPAPDFAWYRNDIQLSDPGQTTPPVAIYGTTTNAIVRQLSRNDDQATFRCDVENDANRATPKTVTKTISVLYKPVIDLGPYNPLVVVMGEKVVLTCDTDANPTVPANDIDWYNGQFSIGQGTTYSLPNVQPSDSGTYRCEASHSQGSTSASIALDVQYGPVVTMAANVDAVGTEFPVNENSMLNITCQVDANPVVTPNDIVWNKAGVAMEMGASYVLSPVKREDSGEYECRATHQKTPSGESPFTQFDDKQFTVRVYYKPGTATVTVPDEVIKGDPATLTCTLDDPGDPAAYFAWQKLGGPVLQNSTAPTLTLPSTTLADSGDYSCTPENFVGAGNEGRATLDVDELPEWLSPQLPVSLIQMVNETGLRVECRARGSPDPEIRWYKDGVAIDQVPGWFRVTEEQEAIDEFSWNVTSALLWEGFEREPTATSLNFTDAGNYSCHVTSPIDSVGLTSVMALIIEYPPYLRTPAEKVAINRNDTAVLSCSAHSYPPTTFQWYNGSLPLTPGGRVSIEAQTFPGEEYPQQSFLSIADIRNSDFGDYFCEGSNSMGSMELSIELTVKDVPDAPTDLEILSYTWESVSLQWREGFDGGYQQDFVIVCRYYDDATGDDTEEWKEAGVDSSYNVTMLFPAVDYTFQVFAQNTLGASDGSGTVTHTTDDLFIPTPTTVVYDTKSRVLTFESPSDNYCARVEIDDGGASGWQEYEPCAPSSGSIKIREEQKVDGIRVALCLDQRPEVCSEPEAAEIVGDDLPVETIIIVACVCGGVVIILTIVLVVLCCRRQQAKKNYEKSDTNPMEPVRTNAAPVANGNGQLKPALKNNGGIENPGLDRTDSAPIHQPSIYYTTPSLHPPEPQYSNGYPPAHAPNGYTPNGYGPTHPPAHAPSGRLANGGNQWSNSSYDNQLNNQNELQRQHSYGLPPKVKPRTPDHSFMDESYSKEPIRESSASGSANSDSGVSTPDPQKPKKIIHEVIV